MNKVYCDKCGKEWNNKFFKITIQSGNNALKNNKDGDVFEKFDFCEECYLKFIKELKGEEKIA